MYLIVLTIAFIKHITHSSYQTKKLFVLSDVLFENCLVSLTTEQMKKQRKTPCMVKKGSSLIIETSYSKISFLGEEIDCNPVHLWSQHLPFFVA